MSVCWESEYERRKREQNKVINCTNNAITNKENSNKIDTNLERRGGGHIDDKTSNSSNNTKWGAYGIQTLASRKTKRPGQLSDEDKDDLRRYFGSSGSGVTIVQEDTYYTNESGD